MTHGTGEIDPTQLYSFSQACDFIPSPRRGKKTHIFTLHRWRRDGKIEAEVRQMGGRKFYFIWGATLLRLLGADQCPEWTGRTRSAAARARAEAEREIERLAPGKRRKEGGGGPRGKDHARTGGAPAPGRGGVEEATGGTDGR